MSDLEKMLTTSGLTICGGVLVLVIGQIVMKLFLEPLFAVRSLIGEINDNLVFYAHVYANPGEDSTELRQEAKNVLRQKASLLRARAHSLPLYGLFAFLRLVPVQKDISRASGELIGLSNGIIKGDPMKNHERQKAIYSLLHLPSE